MKTVERYGKVIAMSAAALGMTAALTLESATAYFTTYVSASGGGSVDLGTQTEIYEEQVSMLRKHIKIKNTSENDCFVRVKLFYADPISIDDVDAVTDEEDTGTWESAPPDSQGYWYWNYSEILKAGDTTSSLDVQINVPDGYKDEQGSFNVAVIHECVPVIYGEDGEAMPGEEVWEQTYSSYPGNPGNQGEEAGN